MRARRRRSPGRISPGASCPARVGGLELGGGHGARHAAGVLVDRAVEAAELVVERAAEGEPQPPPPARGGRGQGEAATLGRLLHGGRGPYGLAPIVLEARRVDGQLDGVEDQLRDGLRHLQGDGLLATERERREVRLEPDVVAGRYRRPGQSIGIHGRLLYSPPATPPTAPPPRPA